MRDKIATKIITKWIFKYHFSIYFLKEKYNIFILVSIFKINIRIPIPTSLRSTRLTIMRMLAAFIFSSVTKKESINFLVGSIYSNLFFTEKLIKIQNYDWHHFSILLFNLMNWNLISVVFLTLQKVTTTTTTTTTVTTSLKTPSF